MKATLDIPDFVFRKAKSAAAQRGIPLRQFVTEAVQEKLRVSGERTDKPWMRHFGKLKDLHRETKRIEQRIEDAFEQIDAEEWQ